MTELDDLFATLRQQAERDQLIAAAYERSPRRDLAPSLLVEYRCKARGCLLMHVWRSPLGTLFYKPPHRLSPARTEAETVEAARAKHTSDGYRRWNGHAGRLDDLRGWPGVALSLDCDHFRGSVPAAEVLAAADDASPGRPTLRVE